MYSNSFRNLCREFCFSWFYWWMPSQYRPSPSHSSNCRRISQPTKFLALSLAFWASYIAYFSCLTVRGRITCTMTSSEQGPSWRVFCIWMVATTRVFSSDSKMRLSWSSMQLSMELVEIVKTRVHQQHLVPILSQLLTIFDLPQTRKKWMDRQRSDIWTDCLSQEIRDSDTLNRMITTSKI